MACVALLDKGAEWPVWHIYTRLTLFRGLRTGPDIETTEVHTQARHLINQPRTTLIMDILDDLDHLISQLTANPLPQSLLALDTIQQAKLQSLIPFTLYDLVFSPLPLSPRGLTLTI